MGSRFKIDRFRRRISILNDCDSMDVRFSQSVYSCFYLGVRCEGLTVCLRFLKEVDKQQYLVVV